MLASRGAVADASLWTDVSWNAPGSGSLCLLVGSAVGSEIASRLSDWIQRPLAGCVEILRRINRGMSGYGANSSASNSASAAAAPVGRISRRLAAKNAGYAEKRVAELEVATALAAQKAAAREARNPVEIARALCNAYLHTHRLQGLSLTLENTGGTPLQFYEKALETLSTYDPEIELNPKQERAVRTILLLLIASERGEATTKNQFKIVSDKVGSARLEEFLAQGSEQDIALAAERGGLAALFPYYQGVMERISSRGTTHRPNGKEYTQGEKLAMIEIIENLFKPKTTKEEIQENVVVIEDLGLDEEDFNYANKMLLDEDSVAAEIAAEEGGGEGGAGAGAMVATAAGTAAEIDPRAVSIYQFAKYVLIKYGLSPETAEGTAERMGNDTIGYIADRMDTASILDTNRQTIIREAIKLGASEEAAKHIAEYFVALLTGAATIEPIAVEGGGEGGMEGGRRRGRGRSSRKMKSHRSTKSKKSKKSRKSRKSKKSKKAKKSKKSRRTQRK